MQIGMLLYLSILNVAWVDLFNYQPHLNIIELKSNAYEFLGEGL